MLRRPPSATRTDTLFPYTTLFRSVLRIDDGKVNVVSHQVVELLHAGLDQALADARAVAIIGRPGKLSAGFDLTEMTAGIERPRALVGSGGKQQGGQSAHLLSPHVSGQLAPRPCPWQASRHDRRPASSEERRAGNECVSTCSSRGVPYH